MLHTVNKSPFEKNSLASCLDHSRPGSAILLIEDAVYAAMTGTAQEQRVRAAARDRQVFVLGPDLQARGVEPQRLIDGVTVVDYGGFVDLAVAHDIVQAWL